MHLNFHWPTGEVSVGEIQGKTIEKVCEKFGSKISFKKSREAGRESKNKSKSETEGRSEKSEREEISTKDCFYQGLEGDF